MICYWDKIYSPIGWIHLAATDEGLVYCANAREDDWDMKAWLEKYLADYSLQEGTNDVLEEAKRQLKNYFAGQSDILDVPLKLIGTPFRKRVWEALETIPYGQTRSYGQIAQQIGKAKASRAVGQANHHNPISYFVP